MRVAVTAVCVLAALVMTCVSASMNFLFMKSLATQELEGLVLGGASASADVLKAALPWFVALAWRQRHYLFACIGSAVFLGFSLFSLLSALGFAADMRGSLAGSREAVTEAWRLKQVRITELEAARSGLGSVRSAEVVAAQMAIAEQHARWASTKGCREATLPESREFCQDYKKLEAERVASFEAKRIDKELVELRNGLARLSERGAGGESDPQVAVLARLLSKDRDFVRTMLIVAAALLVEVGSGLGLWLALGHWETRRPKSDEVSALHVTPVEAATVKPSLAAPGPVGDVVEFCLERLHPAPGGVLTVLGLYRSYEVWCRDRDLTPEACNRFAKQMITLARQWEIESAGDTFIGVRVGVAIDWQ